MKVLVVGGSGFIGKTLCPQLLKNGDQVSVLTRNLKERSEWASSINFITELKSDDNYYDVIINLKLYRSFGKDLLIFTQAGGKLNLKNKSFIFNFLKKKGGKFYVMYGQTEAGPRISILDNNDFLPEFNFR